MSILNWIFSFFLTFSLFGCARSTQKSLIETGPRYHLTVFPAPEADQKFPLLVVMHGRGGSGEEYLRVWKKEADQRNVMILAPSRDRGYRNDPKDLEEFYQLVEETVRRYSVDQKRVFLAGISSGALISRWLAVNRPEFWRGVIFIASPGEEAWTSELRGNDFPAVLFVHGKKDDQFQFDEITRHVEILRQKGVEARLLTDPDAGHEHRPEWTPQIFDWIEERGDYS